MEGRKREFCRSVHLCRRVCPRPRTPAVSAPMASLPDGARGRVVGSVVQAAGVRKRKVTAASPGEGTGEQLQTGKGLTTGQLHAAGLDRRGRPGAAVQLGCEGQAQSWPASGSRLGLEPESSLPVSPSLLGLTQPCNPASWALRSPPPPSLMPSVLSLPMALLLLPFLALLLVEAGEAQTAAGQ